MLRPAETERQWRQQRLHVPFEVEEIHLPRALPPLLGFGQAAYRPGQHLFLPNSICRGNEAQTGLEHPDARVLAVEVVGDHRQQAAPQGGTHHRHVRGDRVGQGQRLLLRIQQFLQRRIHEAVGDHLLIATSGQKPPQRLQRQP